MDRFRKGECGICAAALKRTRSLQSMGTRSGSNSSMRHRSVCSGCGRCFVQKTEQKMFGEFGWRRLGDRVAGEQWTCDDDGTGYGGVSRNIFEALKDSEFSCCANVEPCHSRFYRQPSIPSASHWNGFCCFCVLVMIIRLCELVPHVFCMQKNCASIRIKIVGEN